MQTILGESMVFGAVLSIGAYLLGTILNRLFHNSLMHPLLIAVVFTMAFLFLSGVDYDTYKASSRLLSDLLTPATVCLAIPLYQRISLLKKQPLPILLGILAGTLASMAGVVLLAVLFHLTHAEYVTFLPKSVTTAIGLTLSEEAGGIPTLTAAVIIATGLVGNVLAPTLLKLFRITHPIARGLAVGTSSHAIGTMRAMQMGEVEGAMSSLAVAVAGIFTALIAPAFTYLL